MRRPPLAITVQACASCKVVTPISCPMATEPIELFCHTRSGRTIPEDSPGSGNPVFLPNPNRRMYLYRFLSPTCRPILMAPILLDLARTSAMESDA